MGYFGNGFVFQEQPDWSGVRQFPEDLGLVGYAHNSRPVWLLDVWTCTGKEHWHFSDEIDEDSPDLLPLDSSVAAHVVTFRNICAAVRLAENTEVTYGESALRLSVELSRGVGTPVFYFAGDDECTDMAILAEGGNLSELRARFGAYAVSFSNGLFTVTPRNFSEAPDYRFSGVVLEAIRSIPGVSVTDPHLVTGAEALYGNAVQLWPPNAGDPIEMLGVGSWDPFDNVERDYAEVFVRACSPIPAPKNTRTTPAPRHSVVDWEFESLKPVRTVFRYGVYLLGVGIVLLVLTVVGWYLLETLR
jgi:hypothetical protein